MNFEHADRRKFTRIQLTRHVKLDFIDGSYYSKVKDLSMTGMFIIGNFQKHDGKYCLVDLYEMGESNDLSMRASARVVRKNNKGIAITFVSMSPDSFRFLQSILPEPDEYPGSVPETYGTSQENNICFNN